MKRETKRETHAATIDDNPCPCLPPLLPQPHGILGFRRGDSKPRTRVREKRRKTKKMKEREKKVINRERKERI